MSNDTLQEVTGSARLVDDAGPPTVCRLPHDARSDRDATGRWLARGHTARGHARRIREGAVFAAAVLIEGARIIAWTALHALLFVLARRQPQKQAAVLKQYLLRMGPLYIKAGQVLATQTAILPNSALEEFRTFFSDLPAMSEGALRATLARAFPGPIDQLFREFDLRPLAAGSVAQVHRGVLSDGTKVAVKVVKRGVRVRLEASSWLLRWVLKTAHALFPSFRKFEAPAQFAELEPLLVGQCSMKAEAERQKQIADNFRRHAFVRVPKPIEHLSSDDVLVMEFFEGLRGQDFAQASFPRPQLARRLQDMFYCMAYFHGQFHVDPHPGNILFGPKGQILLLDFGLVGKLSEDDKWSLTAFYYACVRKEWHLAVERFTRAFVVGTPAAADYREALAGVLRRHFESETTRWSTINFFDEANRIVRASGARMSTNFSLLSLALLTGEGFISQVDPEIDIWANARRFTDRFGPYMSEALKERFEREFGPVIPRSIEAKKAAGAILVAPTHLDRYVLPSTFPLVVESARGSKIKDIDGNEYIDLSCGYGPHILGYAHPVAVEAISAAAARGAVNAIASPSELRLAELVAEPFAPGAKLVLSNSGTEAVLMALRIARAFTRKDQVAKFEGHYHGFSDQGMVSSWFRISGDRTAPAPIAGSPGTHARTVQDTLVLQYGDPRTFERIEAHADELACVILEPMPAVLADIDQSFLEGLERVCRANGVLVIYDEVVTGFRVHFGGAQHLALRTPDLTCLGKVIGGGLPCGAVLGRAEIIDVAKTSFDPIKDIESKAFVGGTMSGNSITSAAGAAVLEHLRDHPAIYEGLHRKTEWLKEHLECAARARGIPCDVKGSRSIFSITFDYSRPRLIRDRLAGSNLKANMALAYYMRKHGIYMPELHTMMLSDAHDDGDLERIAKAFEKSLDQMTSDGFFAV